MLPSFAGALRIGLRRRRVDGLPLAIVALVLCVTATLAAAAPRAAAAVADASLRASLRDAAPPERAVTISSREQLGGQSGQDLDEPIRSVAHDLFERIPTPVRDLLDTDIAPSINSQNWIAQRPNAPFSPVRKELVLREQPKALEHLELVDGRFPQGGRVIPAPPADEQDPANPQGPTIELEVAISAETAGALELAVGDQMVLNRDPRNPLGRIFIEGRVEPTVVIEVVGVFTATDPADPFWAVDRQLLVPAVGDSSIGAMALIDRSGLELLSGEWIYFYDLTWSYPVLVDRIRAADVGSLLAPFHDLRIAFGDISVDVFRLVTVRTGMEGLLQRFIELERQAASLLSLVGMGLAGIAGAAVAVLGVLLAGRRRGALLMARERGASALQLILPALLEALLICAPAAAVGWLLSRLVLPVDTDVASGIAAAAVGAGGLAALVVPMLGVAFGDLRRLATAPAAAPRVTLGRLVIDGAIVALAVAGIYFLRNRGLPGSTAAEATLVDPYLAAVPFLAGLGAGLVVLRAFPYPVRGLAALAGRTRSLVVPLALQRAGRAAGAAHLPLVALLLAAAVGAFGSIVAASIERGQSDEAWRTTGADYRVVNLTGGLPTTLRLDTIPGIQAVARAWEHDAIPLVGSTGGLRVDLLAADLDALASVTAGTPAAVSIPGQLRDADPVAGIGTPDAPIPAFIAADLGDSRRQVNPGDTFELVVNGERLSFAAVDEGGTFPGVRPGVRFVVIPLGLLERALGQAELRETVLFARGAAGLGHEIRQAIADSGSVAVLTARDERLGALRGTPMVAAVSAGFLTSLGVAALYVALALITGLVLAAAARARDLAYLRTLGLSERQGTWLSVVEQVPALLVAVVAGTLLGVLVAALVAPSLDLRAFTGAARISTLEVTWSRLALAGGFLLLIAAIGLAAGAAGARRVDPTRALRIGEA